MDAAVREKFEAKYKVWKEKLLDLSGSNRLLNFRTTKVSTIQLTLPSATGLFQRLVMAEKSLKFPLYEGKLAMPGRWPERSLEDDGRDQPQATWRVRAGDIETSKAPPELEIALGRLAQLARVSLEERGVNTLYVALGMLEWRPIDGAEIQRAPLLMIPVELKRETRLHPYVLSPFDEDAEVNPSLIYMLRKDFEFATPEFDAEAEESSLDKFFETFQKEVRGRGWRVLSESWLGQFQFKKLAMYKDLEEHSTNALTHQLLTSVAGFTRFSEPKEVIAEHEFDAVRPSEVFTVRDADSSQLAAILRARGGQDLIIQGPPGTGKSQTIANLIAQSLLEGRKVLFVSEKMAALSVVHKRLEEAGLAPFCLEIHSDKANKRDVLARIRRARPAVRPSVSAQERLRFDTLQNHRRELNDYIRTLHRCVLHGKSAFDLHGELSGLSEAPDVIATLNLTADDLTPGREFELVKLARKLAQLPGVLGSHTNHPWYGCGLRSWSMQLQSTVASHFEGFRTAIPIVGALAVRLSELMQVPPPDCLADIDELLSTARLFCTSPAPPTGWMQRDDLDKLTRSARDLAAKSDRFRALRFALDPVYEPALFQNECRELDHALNPSPPSIFNSIRSSDPYRLLGERGGQFRGWLDTCITALQELSRAGEEISTLFEEVAPGTLNECRRLAGLAVSAATDPRPTQAWFDWTTLNQLLEDIREANEKSLRLADSKEHLSRDFTPEFFQLSLPSWKADFAGRYATVWRVLRPDYHRCRKKLRHARKVSSRLSHVEVREKVMLGAEVIEIDAWFTTRREEHTRLLGFHYRGVSTKWRDVEVHAEAVRRILDVERGSRPPKKLMEALLNGGGALSKIGTLGKSLAANIQVLEQSIRCIEEYFDIGTLAGADSVDVCPLASLKSRLAEARTQLTRYDDAMTSFRGALRTEQSRDADAIVRDAAAAREVQEIERYFTETTVASEEAFCQLYKGLGTDWNHVLSALRWSGEFLAYLDVRPWKHKCAEAACAMERIEGARRVLPELEALFLRLSAEKTFHDQVFGEGTPVLTTEKPVERASFRDLAVWLNTKIENIGKLSEWIQFREVREDCIAAGIDDFLGRALGMNVPADGLEHALRKRFLTLELDAVYEQLPRLRKFQWRDHEQLVREFRELDRQLMKTYANLVQAAVIDRQPTLDGPAAGQVGFLRRELAKQKKHAPLRKLFRESGGVILDLTPCLLMSPLSVATFLPKDAIQFDLVIFDEASQVPSEEAIGAVLRGKQLIVAGDAKQLPPTRFFERSLSDDGDEDDESQAPLDSLLEDCDASGMQSCRLLWHYRSKHESLISFSNAEFYGDLITFPAPAATTHVGIGVRLEYVADGVYDRGNSRTNRREAQEVARLVEQHCDCWGLKRSLGVIALSTAQEAAINEEVERLLLRRPDLEALLQPANDEAFFVKPLEHVQGDERDSIIISIGYGKDAAGNLSLNFGPINAQGGEKRLNVAITRARWELTVVSSILAHDIDESRVQSIGPKLLRRYLAFARDGRLPLGTAAPSGESESPFERAVWEALRARGMDVDRQVGTSRYRIDLAIKDPQKPGRYLLGVECDGATYHSSSVARDRDRLRQQVLESLGWQVYRIWSTDWIRDPKGCLLRLVQRIDELKASPGSIPKADDVPGIADVMTQMPRKVAGAEPNARIALPEEDPPDPYDGHPEIDVFHETPTSFRPKEEFYSNGSLVEDDILRVVDREGPIHEELLVRRVARMFQLMRAGHLVESRVISHIASACRKGKLCRRGRFVWSQGKDGVPPRRPAPGAKLRDIDHVPPGELEAAALLVVRLTRGITENELAAEAARVLGYSRISDNIRAATLKAVRKLTKAGTLALRGEQLFIGEGRPEEPAPLQLDSVVEDRVTVICELCRAKLRLPKGRTGMVKCPECAGIFHAQT